MIVKEVPTKNGTARPTRARPAVLQRKRVLLIVLGLLLAGVVLLRLATLQTTSTTGSNPVVPAVAAPLVAHGQVMPTRQAHVGTQSGGVLQRLAVSPGSDVDAQSPIAWVVSASGTELVTAPFAGTVTNVLVHAGDTLVPGATVAVVADLHDLQIETSDIDEFLVSKVSVGQRVQLNIDALDDLAITGTVSNVALLPQSSTSGPPDYPVVIRVGGFPPDVRAGMSVRVTIPETN